MKLFILFMLFALTIFSQYIPYNNRIVKGDKAAVVCSSPIAAQVGIDILKKGGNAFDAAIAIGFTMAVTYPQAGNIGGGGFLVGFDAMNGPFTLDYRETAPKASFKDMYLDDDKEPIEKMSSKTRAASGIPGTVKGFWELHKKYGKLAWKDLLDPAIQLAKNGFPIQHYLTKSLNKYAEDFLKHPQTYSIYAKESGFKRGDILIQKDLAKTLQRISDDGADGFYKGKTADLLVKEMNKGNGIITTKDLEDYKVIFRDAISFTFRDHQIISMPPPSST